MKTSVIVKGVCCNVTCSKQMRIFSELVCLFAYYNENIIWGNQSPENSIRELNLFFTRMDCTFTKWLAEYEDYQQVRLIAIHDAVKAETAKVENPRRTA